MRRLAYSAILALNLLKLGLLAGWDTARVILRPPVGLHSGLTRMPYGELDPRMASLLGALISLTPGTTAVAIDLERRELLLHLLDLEQREAALAAIRRDLLGPLLVIRGDTK